MTTVVELEIPADRLGAGHTFDTVPTFEFQVAGIIGVSPPLVWVSGPTLDVVESALEQDPSVEVIASLADASDDGWLFRLEFGEALESFQRIVSRYDGAILEARGRAGDWSMQLLFHDHESLSAANQCFIEEEFSVEVTRITSLEGSSNNQTPLTETQYEAIVTAHELGYFDVPRKVTLEELAGELGVSHQALSERLRRSHAALVSAELSNRMAPTGIDL